MTVRPPTKKQVRMINLQRLMVAPAAAAAAAAATMATMPASSGNATLFPWLTLSPWPQAEPRGVPYGLPCRTNHMKIYLHIRESKY